MPSYHIRQVQTVVPTKLEFIPTKRQFGRRFPPSCSGKWSKIISPWSILFNQKTCWQYLQNFAALSIQQLIEYLCKASCVKFHNIFKFSIELTGVNKFLSRRRLFNHAEKRRLKTKVHVLGTTRNTAFCSSLSKYQLQLSFLMCYSQMSTQCECFNI